MTETEVEKERRGERERDRVRDRQTDRDRVRDRQTDRDRVRDRQRERPSQRRRDTLRNLGLLSGSFILAVPKTENYVNTICIDPEGRYLEAKSVGGDDQYFKRNR